MLRRYHRLAVLVAMMMLCAPMIVGLLSRGDNSMASERRDAAVPALPRSQSDWVLMPSRIDAYLLVHFGLRAEMILARSIPLHLVLGEGNAEVAVGIDGRMFYRGQDAVRQSAGLLIRATRISETTATIATVRTALAAMGIKFVFASPPNAASIYPESLPEWQRNDGRSTEYDVLLKALAARNVAAVDLRPVLRSARESGEVFLKYDAHWTPRGALAGFNAVAAATGHDGWHLDPEAVLTPPIIIEDEDLPRMLGIPNFLHDRAEILALQRVERTYLEANPAAAFSSAPKQASGPLIMVVGDSFTKDYFPPMIIANGGRVVWIAHEACGFDWKWIEQFHPDEIWWMPTERLFLCWPGVRPKGLPEKRQARNVD